jgi:hypothetical protein
MAAQTPDDSDAAFVERVAYTRAIDGVRTLKNAGRVKIEK